LQRRAGNPAEAQASFLKATKLGPKSAKARVALASLYLDTGRANEGEKQLLLALDEFPNDPDANRAYAGLLVATDRCEDAEPYWKKVSDETADPTGSLSLADYYVYTERTDDALRVLTPLTTERDEGGEARMRVASIYYDRGEKSDAERLANEVLAHEPDNTNALILKSRLAIDRGDRAAALGFARHAARVAPLDSRTAAELLATLEPPRGPRK